MPRRPIEADSPGDVARFLRGRIRRRHAGAFVALHRRKITGVAIWSATAGLIELEQLFVLPSCQGLGLGVMLLTAVQGVALQHRSRTFLWAARNNAPAREWYGRRGGRPGRAGGITWNRFRLPMVRYDWPELSGAAARWTAVCDTALRWLYAEPSDPNLTAARS